MKTLELVDAAAPLAEYARGVGDEPLILTRDGKPIAALVSLANTDGETLSLSTNPDFLNLIERSRAHQSAQGGISSEDMRRRLSTAPARARGKAPSRRHGRP